MQMQCDILQVPVVRPLVYETTALGAAYLAGLPLAIGIVFMKYSNSGK
jgi:glycerol kinase